MKLLDDNTFDVIKNNPMRIEIHPSGSLLFSVVVNTNELATYWRQRIEPIYFRTSEKDILRRL